MINPSYLLLPLGGSPFFALPPAGEILCRPGRAGPASWSNRLPRAGGVIFQDCVLFCSSLESLIVVGDLWVCLCLFLIFSLLCIRFLLCCIDCPYLSLFCLLFWVAFVYGFEIFKFLMLVCVCLLIIMSVSLCLVAGLCPFVICCISVNFAFSVYQSLPFTFGWFACVFHLLLLVIVFCCGLVIVFCCWFCLSFCWFAVAFLLFCCRLPPDVCVCACGFLCFCMCMSLFLSLFLLNAKGSTSLPGR